MPILPEIKVGTVPDNQKLDSLVSQLNDAFRLITAEASRPDYGQGGLFIENNQLLLQRPSGTQVIIVGQQDQNTGVDEEENFKAITADSIEAGTITATEIESGTITADQIAGNTITGDKIASLDITSKTITADTGTIGGFELGATELVGPSGAIIRSEDMTDFGIGSGFWLGNVSGTGKYFFGVQGGDFTSFDGTNIRFSGLIEASSVINSVTYASASLPQPPTTEGFKDPTTSESPAGGSYDTGYHFPAAEGSVAGYDMWVTGENAYASDGSFATTTGPNRLQDYGSFSLGIPTNATIDGVEVKIKGKMGTGSGNIEVSIVSGTSPKTQTFTTTNTEYTLGGPTDLWGETGLTGADFQDADYPVFMNAAGFGKTYYVDSIQLKVYYTVPSGFTNPNNAFSSNNSYATTTATDGDILVALSGDGGSTYTSALTKTYTSSEGSQTYGNGSTELWGTSWLGSNMTDSNFKVKVTAGGVNQVYGTFGFTASGSVILTGIEVSVEAKWTSSTTSVDHVKVKIYYGTSSTPVQAGSIAFATDASTSGALEVYNGSAWKELMDTSTAQTVTNKQMTTIELGHASDTTLARSSAGNMSIEGNVVYRAGGTDVPVADGGTGASTLTGLLKGNGTSAITAVAAYNPYCFRAYDSGGTTLTDATPSQINLATENYDYNSNFASSTYTAPVAGVYHFFGACFISTASATLSLTAYVYVNGASVAQNRIRVPSVGGQSGIDINVDLLLAASDTVTFYVAQDSDGNETTQTGSDLTYFGGHLIHAT